MLNKKEALFKMLYIEMDGLVQDVQKIHASFYGYTPKENDICALRETNQESGNYILQQYLQGSWKNLGTVPGSSVPEVLRKYTKVLSFGHFDEGYYRN